jgi:hypothetical protein
MRRTATEKFSFPDMRSIDSRFLDKAAVLASRKAKNAAFGDGSQDVDIDDFISKCINFMRKGDEALLESNPARSGPPRRVNALAELNWKVTAKMTRQMMATRKTGHG